MNLSRLRLWFVVASTIMVLVGLFFAFFGLAVLPVDREVLSPWQNGVYGATFMGWGTTLLFVGSRAFHHRDPDLMKALLYGLFVWFAAIEQGSQWRCLLTWSKLCRTTFLTK
jgi:hypothetical protein